MHHRAPIEMAMSLPLKVKSFFRPKLGKRTRSCSSSTEADTNKRTHSRIHHDDHVTSEKKAAVCSDVIDPVDGQLQSAFFQKLPLEIRRMVYEYVWSSPQDHMFHIPSGRHIYFQDGHWYSVRCVMNEMDEDLDFIQKQMDRIYELGAEADDSKLELWQRRSSQTWGHRHWRCEERIHHPREPRVDRRNFAPLMVVCRRM